MNHLTTSLRTLAALAAAAGLLSACGTPPQQPAVETAQQTPAKSEKRVTTGSRLPAGDSTQIVRTISGSSANETMRSQPNPGRPGN